MTQKVEPCGHGWHFGGPCNGEPMRCAEHPDETLVPGCLKCWRRDDSQYIRVLSALSDLVEQFDAGMFVRNTDNDGCSDWAIKAAKPLMVLATAKQLVVEGEARFV